MNTKFGDLIRKVNVTLFPVERGGRAVEMSPCPFSNQTNSCQNHLTPFTEHPQWFLGGAKLQEPPRFCLRVIHE